MQNILQYDIIIYLFIFKALWRQAVKKKFATQKKNSENQPRNHKIIKKIIALALLPESEIENAFQKIKKECEKKKIEDYSSFFNYYEETWINGYKPHCFSVYKQIIRTNNSIESYHRVLNTMITRSLTGSSFLST